MLSLSLYYYIVVARFKRLPALRVHCGLHRSAGLSQTFPIQTLPGPNRRGRRAGPSAVGSARSTSRGSGDGNVNLHWLILPLQHAACEDAFSIDFHVDCCTTGPPVPWSMPARARLVAFGGTAYSIREGVRAQTAP